MNEDLLGDSSPTNGASGDSSGSNGGMAGAVAQGIRQANPENSEASEAEEKLVKETWDEYKAAREFDQAARLQMAKDRRYAAGKADPAWVSDANIVGSMIDILVSFLYAQNPDVSVKPSKKVGKTPDPNATDFAATCEIIVPRLWRDGNLKKTKKKSVRGALSVGQGWTKSLMYTEQRPCPQVEKDILTQQNLLASLKAQQEDLNNQVDPPEDRGAAEEAIKITLQGLQAKKEASMSTGQCFDALRAEDVQVSLDVSAITDYLDADWVSNDMYILKSKVKAKFPRLTDEDIKTAAVYYQRQSAGKDQNQESVARMGESAADGMYQKGSPPTSVGGAKPVEFIKVVEMWRKCQGMVVTMVDGVKKWAAEPYAPPQATKRFYPYFLDALFEVEGERHPQSLVFRLFKLQDEYSACRSNQRTNRERSIVGTLFDRSAVTPEDADKLAKGTIQEYIGINTNSTGVDLQKAFAPKPVAPVNAELYNTAPITADMERISGVQEALQSSSSAQPKTATEAHIQQTGFASRTNADRDTLEDGLTDLAHYSVETAIQEMRPAQAQKIAGDQAFWPYGMDVDDILTLVDIDIVAGSTGKPDSARDAQNWSTILPMMEQLLTKIRGLQQADPAMAAALMALARETLKRLDDRLDIDQFIPPPETAPPPQKPQPEPPRVSVNIGLTGQLPPQDVPPILAAADPEIQEEAAKAAAAVTGQPPGAPPTVPAGATHLPGGAPMPQLPGGVPMPPLHAKPAKDALKPGPSIPGAAGPPK